MKSMLPLLRSLPAPLRLLSFLGLLLLVWLPPALAIVLLVTDVNLLTILTLVLLYLLFLGLVQVWGRHIHRDGRILQTYGLRFDRPSGVRLLRNLAIGFSSQMVLFLVQGWLGWLTWQTPSGWLPRILLEGLLVALGIGFAEELLFRGWMLDELQRDYHPVVALWVSSLVYAALHFVKPLPELIRTFPQFPGLVLLGLTLVWAKRSAGGQLSAAIGLHAGLVWGYYLIDVADLVAYTGTAPPIVTGIDQNPLAGLVGLVFLSGLALTLNRRTRSKI